MLYETRIMTKLNARISWPVSLERLCLVYPGVVGGFVV
jgi:hypothetical protein